MARVAERLFGEGFRWDGIHAGGSLDPVIFAEAAVLNAIEDADTHHITFRDQYVAELQRELTERAHQLTVMPGVAPLLDDLRRRVSEVNDLVLGLLTGNYSQSGELKLRAAGFDPEWFTVTCFGDEAPTRPDLVELAMRKYERLHGHRPDPRRVIVIGDTPRDVHCAKAHGCIAFAVATGQHPIEELLECGADVAVEDLADASPLMALLEA